MTWQMNNIHSYKFGIDNIQHENSINEYSIRDINYHCNAINDFNKNDMVTKG